MIMTMPVKAEVDDATQEALAAVCLGDPAVLEDAVELRETMQEAPQAGQAAVSGRRGGGTEC